MRILHVIHNLVRAGAQVNLANLLETAHPRIEKQAVVAFKSEGEIADRLRANGIAVYGPHGAGLPAAWNSVKAAIMAERPDLLHAHMSEAAILSAAIGWRHRLPMVMTHHDGTRLVPDMAPVQRRLRLAALHWAAPRAAFHTAITTELRIKLQHDLPIDPASAIHVRNATPIPSTAALSAAQATRSRRTENGTARVVTLGRLVDVKGYDGLIAAAAHLPPTYAVDIYGEGPLRNALETQISSLLMQNRDAAAVTLRGATGNPAAVLADADVFVSSSHYEGTSLALLEAMAWRVPIVASDVPGNRELIRDGMTGRLYPHGDAAALADAIRSIVDSPTLAARMTAAAADEITAHYGTDAVLDRYAELYARTVAK